MKGRLEHELRTKQTILRLLSDMPTYVSDFYYNIQVSKEPSTCLEYIRKIKHFFNFAGTDIKKIDETIITRYFEEINYTLDEKGSITRTSYAYRQSVWTALNQLFSYAARREIIKKNYMENIERPPKKDQIRRSFLAAEQLNLILEAAKSGAGSSRAVARQKEWVERDISILFLFMCTGTRKTALSEINVEDISFEERSLIITDKRNKTSVCYITDEMMEVLQRWLNKREKLLNGRVEDGLFISSLRKRMSEKAIYSLVQKYSKEALGYSISPHKLRAAFASLYYEESGGDIKAVSEAMGHADIATTSIYITKRNDSRQAAQKFMSGKLKL